MAGDVTDPFIRMSDLFERQLSDAEKHRKDLITSVREQTEVIRTLTTVTQAHNDAAAARHSAVLSALVTHNEGAKTAVEALIAHQTWPHRVMASVGRELWPTFRTPFGMLITAVCAFLCWRFFGIPTTPTPIQTIQASSDPPPGQVTGVD